MINNSEKISGSASFIKKNNYELIYREEGINTTANKNLKFYREYLYVLADGHISVYFFEESKLFYTLQFSKLAKGIQAKAQYICNKDKYAVTYFFQNKNHFEVKYTVKGPSKNYIIDTFFLKIN